MAIDSIDTREATAEQVESDPPSEITNPARGGAVDRAVQEDAGIEELRKKLLREFHRANSAVEAANVVQKAVELDLAVARDWQVKLESFCCDSCVPSGAEDAPGWHEKRQLEYCSGYLSDQNFRVMDALDLMEYYEATHKSEFEELLSSRVSEMDSDLASRWLLDQAANARWPEEVDAVMRLLPEFSQLGVDVISGQHAVELGDALRPEHVQSAALQLFSCSTFGGCGPASIFMVERCIVAELCQPGWHYEDFMQALLTPLEYQAALELARELASRRSR